MRRGLTLEQNLQSPKVLSLSNKCTKVDIIASCGLNNASIDRIHSGADCWGRVDQVRWIMFAGAPGTGHSHSLERFPHLANPRLTW